MAATERRVEVSVLTLFTEENKRAGGRIYFVRATVLMQKGILPGNSAEDGEGQSQAAS